MRRRGLFTLATLMVASGGFMASGAGWSSQRSSRPVTELSSLSPTTVADALSTQAGVRYRQSQPHHWRECLLQH
jgi:hypothetical protein